ncbi:chymotrypsin-1-like [Solenopsis invicta]|uniref:chymotrypsin-1-like n=1 Tax=Solenopsis invicta TaxID=13686 RepID=UPI000595A314|nr:chymotrypsin-1-like [Solenopsis invicta]
MKLLSCIVIALAVVGVYGDEPEKLVNAIPSSINEYPHCVSMRNRGQHMCGGSIIGPKHVLTAAHCVQNLPSSVTIVSGTSLLNQGGESHRIEKVFAHENYNPYDPSGRGPYDIALIKLLDPITFNSQQKPIALPTSDIMKNDAVTIAAWGSTGLGQRVHNDLRKLMMNAMLPGECQRLHGTAMKVAQSELCTLTSYGTGLCHGDSGSGLVRNKDNCIIGLVSGGRPCARGYPDIFTNVWHYKSWIENKMLY